MTTFVKSTITAAVAALLLTCGNFGADARRAHRHIHPVPCRTVIISAVPPVTVRVHNHFNREERLQMALVYLRGHDYLTVGRYARMTGLERKIAKAGLEAFAHERHNPLCAVQKNSRRVYVLRTM